MSDSDRRQPSDSTNKRRQFLGWSAVAGGLGTLLGLETFWWAPDRLDVTHHTLTVPDLPDQLDGYTIAHLTDLHFGSVRGAHQKALAWIEDNDPDLVVCTGDLVEGTETLPAFESYTESLADTANQIVAVLGNWERRWDDRSTEALVAAYERCDVPVLVNETEQLDDGLVVTGADDPVTGHFRADAAFADVPDAPFRLLLVHAPNVLDDRFPEAPTYDLALAGHTHGGQFRIGPYAPVTPSGSGRFTSGFYETELGRAYVSRGVGMTFLRGRFMCPPELPVFTLRTGP